ncbi:hypothetical protein C0W42_19665 [Photobacterium kishitanii]|uniref:hypothetical protein n=1 Tax=Photobacterium kishitanii TaxID=318456 RepID=UPI000D1758F1|nr:hypothetical protein [Photobacterium kishitanii]PSU86707.1 hypothetical protein C0W42_19665 [Photobacterium kishitanii]
MSDIKTASALAKDKRFNEAIEVLDSFYSQGEASRDDLIKIIPYFQEAGRYSEVEVYCEKVIIPNLKNDNESVFSHKCVEIREAFFNLALHKMYAKISLCAKREKIKVEEEKYSKLSDDTFEKYQSQLVLGESIEDCKGFEQVQETFGRDLDDWPSIFKIKYQHFL